MATTVTFDDGAGHVLTLPAPAAPGVPGTGYPAIVGRTMGFGVKRADLGDGSTYTDDPTLSWDILPDADEGSVAGYQSLFTYISSTLSWGETPVTYTDVDGGVHTNMYYAGGIESFRRLNGELWSGSINLVKDMSV